MDHLPEWLTLSETEGGFSLTLRPDFPMTEARCLAVVCAQWARQAAGPDAKLMWPNRVELDGKLLCAITCRAAASGELVFTYAPTELLPVPPDAFARDVPLAAARDLAGYPANRPSLMDSYCASCGTVKKYVEVSYRGMPVYGFAFAVDRHGGLMVMTQESRTVITVYGGEARVVSRDDMPVHMPDVPTPYAP